MSCAICCDMEKAKWYIQSWCEAKHGIISKKITFCVFEENQMVSKINLRESKIDVLWSMYRTCSFGSSCGEVNYGVRDLGRWKGHDPQKKLTRGGNWNLQKVGEHWINFDKGGKVFFFQTGPGTPLLKTTYSGKRPQTARGIGRIMRENVDDGDR